MLPTLTFHVLQDQAIADMQSVFEQIADRP
jgi:hypothetical protein